LGEPRRPRGRRPPDLRVVCSSQPATAAGDRQLAEVASPTGGAMQPRHGRGCSRRRGAAVSGG
jgi:hypothetical protein